MRVGLNFLYVGVTCCLFLIATAQEFSHGDVRLEDGSVSSEGRVEVYDSEIGWGTVCNDNWDLKDADVVCRQLQYDNASDLVQFGKGTGPILLNGLQCLGNESNLYECPSDSRRRCDHSNDAGVVCQPVDEPTGPDPLTIGIYVIIPFAVLVALLLIIIGALLFLSLTHNREARHIEEQNFQNLRFKGLSLKDQNKLRNEGVFRKRRNTGLSRSSSYSSPTGRNIPRAALGEGAAHPWQLTVQNDSTEAKIELVPATREGTDSCEKSPSQQTIGVLNPLASVMADDQKTEDEQSVPKRYIKPKNDEEDAGSDSDSSLDPYD